MGQRTHHGWQAVNDLWNDEEKKGEQTENQVQAKRPTGQQKEFKDGIAKATLDGSEPSFKGLEERDGISRVGFEEIPPQPDANVYALSSMHGTRR